MTETVTVRRLAVGKAILFLALCWVVLLVSVAVTVLRAATFEPLNLELALIPGCALVPAAHFAVRLHRASTRDQIGRVWPKTLVYGIAGVALLLSTASSLYLASQI